jgi:hypothetical protein
VGVESIQRSTSTLVTLSVPIELWAFLPESPAYALLGLVKTENLLLQTGDLNGEKIGGAM